MPYHIDLHAISLVEYTKQLIKSDLLPSRRILQQEAKEQFSLLQQLGIATVYELQQRLKTKKKLNTLADQSGVSTDYLLVLSREINSIQPKPNKFAEIPGVSPQIVQALAGENLNDTFALYPHVLTPADREQLAARLKVSLPEVLEVTKLADLSRIRWVGNTFARVLYQTGFDTQRRVADADHEQLYQAVKQINEEKNLFNGQIGLHDMKRCVDSARELPSEIVY